MTSYYEDPAIKRIEAALPPHLVTGPEVPEESFVPVNDFEVHIDRWRPQLSARARVLLLHGGGGHGRLLAPYARMAVRAGAEAVAPDLPGYGLTTVPRKSAIRYEDWREVATQILRREQQDGLPVIVFGLSMGGLLAYDAVVAADGAAGLIATCFLDASMPRVQRETARTPWLAGVMLPLLRLTAPLTDNLCLPMTMLAKMSTISNHPALTRAIIADKRAGGNAMPLGFLRSYTEAPPLLAPEKFDLCEVVLAHPAEDRWTDLALSLPFFEALKVPKELVMLKNCGHAPIEQPGTDQLQAVLRSLVDKAAQDKLAG